MSLNLSKLSCGCKEQGNPRHSLYIRDLDNEVHFPRLFLSHRFVLLKSCTHVRNVLSRKACYFAILPTDILLTTSQAYFAF